MQTSMIILQNGRLDPTNRVGDQVVRESGRADMKGMENVMRAEMTRFVSSSFVKP